MTRITDLGQITSCADIINNRMNAALSIEILSRKRAEILSVVDDLVGLGDAELGAGALLDVFEENLSMRAEFEHLIAKKHFSEDDMEIDYTDPKWGKLAGQFSVLSLIIKFLMDINSRVESVRHFEELAAVVMRSNESKGMTVSKSEIKPKKATL